MKTFQSPASVSTADALRRLERSVIYRFGTFELSTLPLRLSRAGRLITLQPQPARALKLLIEHRGKIVTREMLRDHLWGKGTFLDHEQGINFALRKIRIALGDSPSAPDFIETVPRLGYRFVADIEEVSPASAGSTRAARATEQPPERPDGPTEQSMDRSERPARTRRSGLLGRYPTASCAGRHRRNTQKRQCRSWS